MIIDLQRISHTSESTIGALSIDGAFSCWTIEDAWHVAKIPGATRIPEGAYDMHLRTSGGLTQRYHKRFGEMHHGMLWLQDVPDFTWVYIHTGNRARDSEGCILVGDTAKNNQLGEGYVGSSAQAYRRIYTPIAQAILDGEGVKSRTY